MKVITLTQPYASLVAIGAKRIETRSWATSYRGPLAIHAAKGLNSVGGMRGLQELCNEEPFLSALAVPMVGMGITKASQLPFGQIIAVVELVDCVTTEAVRSSSYVNTEGWWEFNERDTYWRLSAEERAFGDYSSGRWAWLLRNVQRLKEPIPAKGALSLWECDTDEIMAMVEL